jgi:hypothetical protein
MSQRALEALFRKACREYDRSPAGRRRAFPMFVAAAEAGHASSMVCAGVAIFEGAGVRRDRKAALSWSRRAERHGEMHALFNLGQMHRKGAGLRKSARRAEAYYRRAARKGHPGAMWHLAAIARRRGDLDASPRWLARGAEAGDPICLRAFGVALRRGKGVRRDPATAARAWFRKAASLGIPAAKRALAMLR